MKTKINILHILSLSMFMNMACGDSKQQGDDQQQPAPVFSNPQDAVKKAKQDLIAVLRLDSSVNIGVDAASVEGSEPGKTISQSSLNFDKLLEADSATTVQSLTQGEENTIVPLMTGQEVSTVVELSRDDKGWRVAALGGKTIADELNTVMRSAKSDTTLGQEYTVTMYQVANLRSRIYGLKGAAGEVYFTNYSSRFSLEKGVSERELLQGLKEDAMRFRKEIGDKVKKEPLTD